MKLNFCCACGSQEDLHQHHIIPTSLSGMKRSETNLEDTITLCYNHHRMIHGVQNGQINHSELVIKGLIRARNKGTNLGRRSKLTDAQKLEVIELLKTETVSEVARFYKVSRATIISIRERNKVESVLQ